VRRGQGPPPWGGEKKGTFRLLEKGEKKGEEMNGFRMFGEEFGGKKKRANPTREESRIRVSGKKNVSRWVKGRGSEPVAGGGGGKKHTGLPFN